MADYISKAESCAIDRQIQQDKKLLKSKPGILLIGTSGSGKTTLLKQVKILHEGGFSATELAKFRPIIFQNVLDSAQAMVMYMRNAGLACVNVENITHCEKILKYTFDVSSGSPQNIYLSTEITNAICCMWADPIMVKIMEDNLDKLRLMDNTRYFLNNIHVIGKMGYTPNQTDALYAYQKTEGLTKTEMRIGSVKMDISELGGLHYGHEKLFRFFENMSAIMFFTAISDYDKEDWACRNRLGESIVLFEAVVNSPWFSHSSIILYLNKLDLLIENLPEVPLKQYFTDYTGGNDLNKAIKYILSLFMKVNRAGLRVFSHAARVIDPSDTCVGLLSIVIKEAILENSLKDHQIL
ncbi:guanine nucleotide binding protein, alpha subunit [Collybia nuda]|uniref:Guanine nucleotide binding protein, alpha subunit n=1 Tax=Collybia nuda TaxID=64659 RepID=A0A9P5Y5W8_9AGAR|nr:guanine nucleotide binding protein, alpha subunit [Collybia nuda]